MNPELLLLEDLMDTALVNGVLELMRDICNEKAYHLRSNWQDDRTAQAWERAARALDRAATHPAIVVVSR